MVTSARTPPNTESPTDYLRIQLIHTQIALTEEIIRPATIYNPPLLHSFHPD